MKNYIVVTDVVNDVTYSRKSVNTRVVIIQLLPLSEGDMAICSPEAGNIARGRSPRAI